ncbi:MAG: hypothetical protein ACJASQ_000326 [Crocinitomicaceae bacterium]
MNKFLVCIALLIVHSAWSQIDVPVVGNKDGQWRIINESKEILMPRSVHYINHFDSKNLAYYKENNKVGIINSKGKIIYEPSFRAVKMLGNGIYHCYTDKGQQIVDFSTVDLKSIDCISAYRLDDAWYSIQNEDGYHLFNYLSKKLIDIDSLNAIRLAANGYVSVIETDSLLMVYNTAGEEFLVGRLNIQYWGNRVELRLPKETRVIYPNYEFKLPTDVSLDLDNLGNLIYSWNGETNWANPSTGEILRTLRFDRVWYLQERLIAVEKNGKQGLYHLEKGLLTPIVYDGFSYRFNDSKEFYAVKNQLTGIISENGKVKIPCKYLSIYEDAEWYYVSNSSFSQGLISKITNREFLPCIYDGITIDGDQIKAQSGTKLKVIKYDKNHSVVSSVTIKNVVQLTKSGSYRRNGVIDPRLYAIGWFTETQKKFDRNDFFLGYVDNWGFKDKNDSILIKAKHAMPLYVENAEFTLVPHDSIGYTFQGIEYKESCNSALRNTDGRMAMEALVIGMDTLDFKKRMFARVSTDKGLATINSLGKPTFHNFIGREQGKYIRFCDEGTIIPVDFSSKEKVQYPALDLGQSNNSFIGGQTLAWKYDGDDYSYIEFEEGKWNFLDLEGNHLFTESFEFVNEFKLQRSIAKKDGKWGLLSSDTTIVPFKYSNISRVKELGDSVFLVQSSAGGSIFLDSNSVELDFKIKSFVRSKGALNQVIIDGKRKVIDADNKIVSGDSKSQKLMDGGWFYTKSKKVMSIYDGDGMSLGEYDLKPIERMGEDAFLFKKGSRYGVINSSAETVIPFEYKEITKMGTYYFAKNGAGNLLLDANFEVVRKCKSADVLVDNVTGNYLTVYYGKVKVYRTSDGKKVGKSTGKPTLFHNGWIFNLGKDAMIATHSEMSEVRSFKSTVEEIEVIEGYGYLFHTKDHVSSYVNLELEPIEIGNTLKRSESLGKGFVTGKFSQGIAIYNAENWMKFKKDSKIYGTFNDKYILVKEEGKYYYLDQDFKNPMGRYYNNATPFNGSHAAVEEREGWAIIDDKGVFKTLPTYSGMKNLGPNLFSIPAFSLYGLIDNDGNEILPSIYKKITFIHPNLIQVIHEGDIKYFNASGMELKIYK